MKPDLQTEADIKLLVDTFYERVNQDELLSPVFNEVAQVNWPQHLLVMYAFWSSVLFGSMGYKGRPFPKHMRLPLTQEHFNRWLLLFTQAVDDLYSGPVASQAKQKAKSIAHIFQMKMGLLNILPNSSTIL